MRKKNEKRSDGRLQSKVYLGHANGKKCYKYVYATTQKELDTKVQELKIKLGKGIDLSAQKDSFSAWGDRWLKKKKSSVSENWGNAVDANYKKLKPLYNVAVSELRCADLEDILLNLKDEGYSDRVMQAVKQIAESIMRDCVKNRIIEYNPFSDAELPKANANSKEPRRALTDEERQWIVDTPHRAQTAAMIMMYAGLRRGELIPLQWSDIDLEEGTITISRTVEMIKGKPRIKSFGKTESALRTVYIPQILVNYLKDIPHSSFFVVHMTNGQMFTHNAWRSMWNSYIKDLNFKYGDFGNVIVDGEKYKKPKSKTVPGGVPIVISGFTAHWLRHTFITLMYLSGVDVLTASKQAGHSDIKITMEIYTHLDQEYQKKNIKKLDEFLSGGCQRGVKNADSSCG